MYINKMVAVATVITAVGTTANAYWERKQKKKEQIQKVITENRYRWLEQVRIDIANLYAAERTYIDSVAAEDNDKARQLIKDIDLNISKVILYLPYEENDFCDEIYCLATDVKNFDDSIDYNMLLNLLCRIRAQENKCRKILKRVWEEIKEEAGGHD